jgi:peptidoglycan L-alanyl-D-glutamate endopeptidase CwlK
MAFKFSTRSLKNLQGVHPDLVRVIRRALELTTVDFVVVEGLRTVARQKQLLAAGASKTMNSRHLTGHAVDLAPMVAGQIRWDWPLFHKLAPSVQQAAAESGVPIEWGGDWRFKDGPHWQLPWSSYP